MLLIVLVFYSKAPVYGGNTDELIVFSANFTGNWDIWTYRLDTHELKQITNTPEDETNPIWLKHKRSIAYLRGGHIFLYGKHGEKQLTSEGTYRYLSFDLKGDRIIFSKFDGEEAELGYIRLANGKEGIFLLRPGQQIHPRLTSDGQVLYFVEGYLEDNRVVQEIWSYDSRSPQPDLLYKEKDKPFFRPDISPDGKRLIFVTVNQEKMVIGLGDSTGKYTELAPTRAPFVDYPCWSRDQKRILYTVLVENRQRLAIYDLERQNVEILKIDAECKEGKW
jgi:Tol biopolymer transport system component